MTVHDSRPDARPAQAPGPDTSPPIKQDPSTPPEPPSLDRPRPNARLEQACERAAVNLACIRKPLLEARFTSEAFWDLVFINVRPVFTVLTLSIGLVAYLTTPITTLDLSDLWDHWMNSAIWKTWAFFALTRVGVVAPMSHFYNKRSALSSAPATDPPEPDDSGPDASEERS